MKNARLWGVGKHSKLSVSAEARAYIAEVSSSRFLSGVSEEGFWNEFEEKNTSTSGMRVMSGSFILTAEDVGANGSVRNTASLNRGSDSAGTNSGIPGVGDGELSPLCTASV